MTGLAGILVYHIIDDVAEGIPQGVIDIVNAVRPLHVRQHTSLCMAGIAFGQRTCITLEHGGSHVVICRRVGIGPFSVGAPVTALAGNAPVTLAEAEQGVIILCKTLVYGKQGRR